MQLSSETARAEWRAALAPFERPSLRRSLGGLATSVLPYLLLWAAMLFSLRISYWLTLALGVIAAGFLVRSFIICHDCGHGAFFDSPRANRVIGYLTGLIAFLPSTGWSQEHARHHAGSGNLDRRGSGEIWTLTVAEYRAARPWRRLAYRLYRHPLVLLGLGPLYVFLLNYRFWHRGEGAKARWSKVWTNLGLAAIVLAASLTIGLKAYLAIQLPVILIAGTAGIWLFYVQHQFEGTYWRRSEDWSYLDQALAGASFYRLPRLLQWLTGNIGYHHIHHLSPRIPNYFLQACHESSPLFRAVPALTLRGSLRCLRYRLWDEEAGRLVGFAEAGRLARAA